MIRFRRASQLALTLSAFFVSQIWAAGPDVLRVGKSVPQSFAFSVLDVGIKTGMFEKRGLNLEVSAFGGGPRLIQALSAGSLDIGLATGPDINFLVKGAPAKAVAAIADPPLEMVLLVNGETAPSIADLKKKKIGVSGLTSLTAWLTRELSRRQGWGPDGIELVPISTISGNLALFQTRQVDGIVIDLASALKLQRGGTGKILLRYGEIIPHLDIHVALAANDLIAKRPDLVRKFLDGWFETIAYMQENRDKVLPITAEVQGADLEIAAQSYDAVMPEMTSDGRFSVDALLMLDQSFIDLGLLTEKPDLTLYYTEEFLPTRGSSGKN